VKAALVISERDNVATALEPLTPGQLLDLNGVTLKAIEAIASGHKVALRDIPAGQAVIKYGSPIGIATADIPAGAHVHTHNVASTRGRGDLEAGVNSQPPTPPPSRATAERAPARPRRSLPGGSE
jgi:altronate dehydratase